MISAPTVWARLHGRPLPWPSFPAGGQTFQAGVRYTDLAEGGLPTIFARVAPTYYRTHLGLALCYYQHRCFPMLQVVWPDIMGRFPWDERSRTHQQCFFDQRRLVAVLAAQTPIHPSQETSPGTFQNQASLPEQERKE